MSKIKYIIGHWTGVNSYNLTQHIMQSYQLIIGKSGETVKGLPTGQTASTAGMNSITYNISCAGGDIKAPMTKLQMEKFYCECARAIKEFGLTVKDFYTHAEIGEMVKNGTITKLLPDNKWLKDNIGKIDLSRLPYENWEMRGKSSGDFIRNKIEWYLNRI